MVSLITILTTVLVVTTHHKAAHASDLNSTVDLGYATYTGVATTDKATLKWLGIRYAAPPVGNLRFKAPQAPLVSHSAQVASKVCTVPSLSESEIDKRSMGIPVFRQDLLVTSKASRKIASSSMSSPPSIFRRLTLSICTFKAEVSTQTPPLTWTEPN